ncbi:MAG: type II toxin-antitoxin system VapC family toxin [Planctomycetes bacterium]|nr:type II toxin-antitoxin system VapC family toxin [Planctomycetota bacterium]
MPTATERIQEVTQPDAAAVTPKVALDTCCVQYYINNPPLQPWADCLDPIFQAGVEGLIQLYVSTVVISELLAHVHFNDRHNTGYDPELYFLAIMDRHFQVLDVDSDIARAAGRLRGTFLPGDKIVLSTPDSLIGATSLHNGHTVFVTNDRRLAEALPGENCIYLKDLAMEWMNSQFPSSCLTPAGPVRTIGTGKGLPGRFSLATLELGSIRPHPTAKWQRILKDAHTVAAALNEPCIFFVLTGRNGHKIETREVLFWHKSLAQARSVKQILKRLHQHLGYSQRTGRCANKGNSVRVFCFTSLVHEKARLTQPCFDSKSDRQKEIDAWNAYLFLFRTFRIFLSVPQTSWFLCEDGKTRVMGSNTTAAFLDQAKNALGWKEER